MNEQETHTNTYVMQGSLAKLIKNSEAYPYRNVKFTMSAKNSISAFFITIKSQKFYQ